jgi:hypothetical protein
MRNQDDVDEVIVFDEQQTIQLGETESASSNRLSAGGQAASHLSRDGSKKSIVSSSRLRGMAERQIALRG